MLKNYATKMIRNLAKLLRAYQSTLLNDILLDKITFLETRMTPVVNILLLQSSSITNATHR